MCLDFIHHLVQTRNSMNMCSFNIRSWNLHLKHFLADTFHANNSSVYALLRQILLLKIILMQTSVNIYPLGRIFRSLLSMVLQYAMTHLA